MSNLQILNNSIRTLDNLYSLNDLHLASGNDPKHRPSLFVRNEQTKELVKEIESENTRSTKTIFALKTIRGGKDISVQGTWACEELVLSYAMWISPKFHLVVLRAFLAMHKGEVKQQQLALPKPKTYNRTLTALELEDLLWLWFINHNMLNFINSLIEPLEKIGSNFLPSAHSQSREYGEFNHYMAPLIDKLIANAELGSANQLPKRTLEQVLGKTTTQRGYHLTKR
ncbi:KilA-N domain-containing protein [Avibacterium paragallinarum]|uniref:KilA-N domain n=2 Tax=Avibacterium paragallinarum TaxID=728 RepID=A0A380X564_AVIPA|nr:KilA-N domain-containing protein [Avibacterium paragallinarum]KAA6207907.1 bacteriocin [Avibacterium paragallinarum]SUU97108.1 KilA-N domain [Avibacterium paragallinarum]